MTSFKNYFTYTFKSSFTRFIVCLVISLLLTVVLVNVYSYDTYEYVQPDTYDDTYIEDDEYKEDEDFYEEKDYIIVRRTSVEFSVITFILGTLCFFVPIMELEPFKIRRNIDTLFNLPVSKFKMGLAHYLNGLIHIVGIFTVCSIYTGLYLISKSNELNLIKFIPYYFLSVLFGIFLYSFVSFAFYQGNTLTDGTLILILYSFVFMLFIGVINNFRDDRVGFDAAPYTAFSPISYIVSIYTNLIEKSDNYYYSNTETYISFVFWTIIGIVSIFGFLYTFAKKKAEDVGEVSNSIFGYKILIPIYTYLLLFISQELDFLHLLIIISAYIGFIIYRRTIKLKKSDYICLALSIVPILLYYIICV